MTYLFLFGELRRRTLVTLFVFLGLFFILWPYQQSIYLLYVTPLKALMPKEASLVSTDLISGFFVPMHACFFTAFLLQLPFMFYQLWCFIVPALYKKEKIFLTVMTVFSLLFFFMGICFAYFIVLPIVFHFFLSAMPDYIVLLAEIGNTLSFVLRFLVIFGFAFEIPILMIVCSCFNLVNISLYQNYRGACIIFFFVLGAIMTPPDIVSQCLLAIPLWLLCELGYYLSILLQKYFFSAVIKSPS